MDLSVESSPNIYKTTTVTSTPSATTTTKEMSSTNTTRSPTMRFTTSTTIVPFAPSGSDNGLQQHDATTTATSRFLVPKGSAIYNSSSSCSSSSSEGFSPSSNSNNTPLANNYIQLLYDDASNEEAEPHHNNNNNNNNNNNDSTNHYCHHHQTQYEDQIDSNFKILPENFKDCPRDDLLVLISRMLTHIISLNDEIDVKISSKELTRFHSRAPPNISIYSYLSRLAHYSSLDNAILIVAVYYIDLLSSTYPVFSINSLTIHRFLLTATTVGAKGLCDSFCSNNHYAKVGGVHVSELNVLELEFLTNVNWRIVPRDFTLQESKKRRNSSTGTLNDDVFAKKYKSGVASAEEVLDLYYGRMVALFGSNNAGWTNDIPEAGTKYVLERTIQVNGGGGGDNRLGKVKKNGDVVENVYSPLKRSADHIGVLLSKGKRRNEST